MLRDAGADIVLMPTAEDMYPKTPGVVDSEVAPRLQVSVLVGGSECLGEGASRPHFFHGVATVVAKLFNIVRPTHAYFGQKDAEQCAVIRRLVTDLLYDITVVTVDTVREGDGLAMSTRNQLLTPAERAVAPQLYAALQAVRELIMRGEGDIVTLVEAAKKVLATVPGMEMDYIRFADADSMARTDSPVLPNPLPAGGICVSGAIRLGGTRLIDNLVVQP